MDEKSQVLYGEKTPLLDTIINLISIIFVPSPRDTYDTSDNNFIKKKKNILEVKENGTNFAFLVE